MIGLVSLNHFIFVWFGSRQSVTALCQENPLPCTLYRVMTRHQLSNRQSFGFCQIIKTSVRSLPPVCNWRGLRRFFIHCGNMLCSIYAVVTFHHVLGSDDVRFFTRRVHKVVKLKYTNSRKKTFHVVITNSMWFYRFFSVYEYSFDASSSSFTRSILNHAHKLLYYLWWYSMCNYNLRCSTLIVY